MAISRLFSHHCPHRIVTPSSDPIQTLICHLSLLLPVEAVPFLSSSCPSAIPSHLLTPNPTPVTGPIILSSPCPCPLYHPPSRPLSARRDPQSPDPVPVRASTPALDSRAGCCSLPVSPNSCPERPPSTTPPCHVLPYRAPSRLTWPETTLPDPTSPRPTSQYPTSIPYPHHPPTHPPTNP